MLGNILAALSAALACTVILWIIREMIMYPVKPGENTTQVILLNVSGGEPALENNLQGLIWLAESGILKCSIVVCGTELDEETKFVAETMAAYNDCISFIENEEIPKWIRRSNF